MRTAKSQIIAMGGHRVHADGGIAHQGETTRREMRSINGDQRIGMTLSGQFQRAQFITEIVFDLGVKGGG